MKTADFKTWVDGIINDGNSIQSEKLKDIQSYVQSLPDEISKSNSADSVQSLYTLIKG